MTMEAVHGKYVSIIQIDDERFVVLRRGEGTLGQVVLEMNRVITDPDVLQRITSYFDASVKPKEDRLFNAMAEGAKAAASSYLSAKTTPVAPPASSRPRRAFDATPSHGSGAPPRGGGLDQLFGSIVRSTLSSSGLFGTPSSGGGSGIHEVDEHAFSDVRSDVYGDVSDAKDTECSDTEA